jgi:hypothetical protein
MPQCEVLGERGENLRWRNGAGFLGLAEIYGKFRT